MVRLPVDSEPPETDLLPDHAPEAVQELIKLPEVVHDKVAAVLYGMEHELVDPLHFKVTEGTGGGVTPTVTLLTSDPLPLQVSV